MGDRSKPDGARAVSKSRRVRGRPRLSDANRDRTRVGSIERGIRVVRALALEGSATLKILAAITGIPASTVFRILETLRRDHVVEFSSRNQTWMVGVESFRIGQSYARRVSFMDVGRKVMHDLADRTHETCSIAVLDGDAAIYVSQVESKLPIRAFIPPTTRVLLHASATGKAMLAHMSDTDVRGRLATATLARYTTHTLTHRDQVNAALRAIRERGWATDDEERYVGMRCIAAPIFNEFCEPIAGLSISGPAKRFPDARIPELAALVVEAAQAIVHLSGGRSPTHTSDQR